MVILSRNDPVSRLRVFRSTSSEDVRDAPDGRLPRGPRPFPVAGGRGSHADEVRIAFDGDAVLFSDEAERVFQSGGLGIGSAGNAP